jgi:hypothetical protein
MASSFRNLQQARIPAVPPWPELDAIKVLLGNSPSQVRRVRDHAAWLARYPGEKDMNEDAFNASIRRFLKTLGVTAQREIEKAVRQALAEGRLKGNEKLPARATIAIGPIAFTHEIAGDIELE